jgi:hypothetical protein
VLPPTVHYDIWRTQCGGRGRERKRRFLSTRFDALHRLENSFISAFSPRSKVKGNRRREKKEEKERMPSVDERRDKNVSNPPSSELFHVKVSMDISKESGEKLDSKVIDFGLLKADQLRGLADIFSMMAANIEYLKKLSPQFEKMDGSIPSYLR